MAVTCPRCLDFTLDVYLMDLFEAAHLGSDRRILQLLPRLSEASRRAAAEGGRLNLVAETWQVLAGEPVNCR